MLGISCVAAQLAASREGLSFMELVTKKNGFIFNPELHATPSRFCMQRTTPVSVTTRKYTTKLKNVLRGINFTA
jgi:hypothetical protein